jgi:hypothetical protein
MITITIVVLALMGPASFLVFGWAIHETPHLRAIIARQATGGR